MNVRLVQILDKQQFSFTEHFLKKSLFKGSILSKQYERNLDKITSNKIMTFRKDIKLDENIPS